MKPAMKEAYKSACGVDDAKSDDYVERSEFRLLMVALRRYIELYTAFDHIDADDDNRITFEVRKKQNFFVLILLLFYQIFKTKIFQKLFSCSDSMMSIKKMCCKNHPRISKQFLRKLCRNVFRAKSKCFDMLIVPVVISLVRGHPCQRNASFSPVNDKPKNISISFA
jgi:hypothetical protein